MNQRASTASAIAPTPSARTVAARSIQPSRGPSWADVQHRTSRSTRSGACAATHMLIIPPIDKPAQRRALDPQAVEQRQQIDAEIVDRVRPGRNR